MKKFIVATAMLISASATAATADYGAGSYTKNTTVCGYGRHAGSPNDCKDMNYRYYAPRVERICRQGGKNEQGAVLKCYNRLTTGNYGARKFGSAKEAREANRLEGKNGSRP